MVKRKSMENCRDCYVLADKSKWNRISSVTFGSFESAAAITAGLAQSVLRDCPNVINVQEGAI